eukprot:1194553-Prorocentrum_minimum.AAC.3
MSTGGAAAGLPGIHGRALRDESECVAAMGAAAPSAFIYLCVCLFVCLFDCFPERAHYHNVGFDADTVKLTVNNCRRRTRQCGVLMDSGPVVLGVRF